MMEFWGIDVKHGGSVTVEPGDDKVVHLSQACLGEVNKDKGNEYVRLFAHKNGQKFVIGILSLEKFPHINLDLVFEDDFKLSHDSKHGSVHFAGYKADNPDPMLEEDDSDGDLEEPIPVDALNNGKSKAKESLAPNDKANAGAKSENAEGKPKVRIVEPAKDAKKNEDNGEAEDDEDEDDEDSEEDEEEEIEDLPSAEAGSEDEDEDESEEEEERDKETRLKPEPSKKRPGESTSKTPISGKKPKFDTPQQKADCKKVSGHTATPHPAKHAAKTPANLGKPNNQAPKSGATFACSSCPRSFGSEQALQSHSKAKHDGK